MRRSGPEKTGTLLLRACALELCHRVLVSGHRAESERHPAAGTTEFRDGGSERGRGEGRRRGKRGGGAREGEGAAGVGRGGTGFKDEEKIAGAVSETTQHADQTRSSDCYIFLPSALLGATAVVADCDVIG